MFSKLIFQTELPTEALFVELLIAGAVVIVAGSKFTRLADSLADSLNIASGWIGLILLATVTSLPELVTGGTATWIGNVDLALGNVYGSCAFNITIIVVLNALLRRGSVLRKVSATHSLTSSFGLALIGLSLIGLVVIQKFADRPRVAQTIELVWCIIILITYFGCMRLIYRFERSRPISTEDSREASKVPTSIYVKIALTATILVATSWWLARLGDILSVHEIKMIGRPLGATFVGACFLALATSLPEIVTSVAAVRLGKIDLALGNIFGSNMFNIFVIPLLKGVSLFRGDALLLNLTATQTANNLTAGLLAMLLTAIAVGGLAYQTKRKLLQRFGFDSVLIALTYVVGMTLLLL